MNSSLLSKILYFGMLCLLVSGMLYAIPLYAELWLDALWDPIISGTLLMKVHGGASLLILIVIGSLLQWHSHKHIHLLSSYNHQKRKKNLTKRKYYTGFALLTSMVTLIITAFGLYYIGGLSWREFTSYLHTFMGIVASLLLFFHSKIHN